MAGLLGSRLATVIMVRSPATDPSLQQIFAIDVCKQIFSADFQVLLLEVVHECNSVDDAGELPQWNFVEIRADVIDDWIELNRQYIALCESLLLLELLILAEELAADSKQQLEKQ